MFLQNQDVPCIMPYYVYTSYIKWVVALQLGKMAAKWETTR